MERDLSRIAAFTDGVMAVAITLLVLNIQVPQVSPDELGSSLVDLLPSLGAYLIAFALVGRFWVVHHNLFEKLRGFDPTLMALNLCFLALIVLVPFAAELYDEYTKEPLAAAVLGAILGLAALTDFAMTVHVSRHGFLREEHQGPVSPVGLGLTLVFLLSVPAAFLSVHLSEALWISTVVLRYPLRRLGERASSR